MHSTRLIRAGLSEVSQWVIYWRKLVEAVGLVVTVVSREDEGRMSGSIVPGRWLDSRRLRKRNMAGMFVSYFLLPLLLLSIESFT